MVAWHRYGTGKCLSLATDRLWRLRFKTGDKYHWRVWSQCIQFLTLSRLMGEHKRIRLETDRSTYQDGEQVRLYAHVLNEDFEPVVQNSFEITVNGVGDNALKRTREPPARPDFPGLYEGYFTRAGPGRYRLEANEDDKEVSNTTEFQVAVVQQELFGYQHAPRWTQAHRPTDRRHLPHACRTCRSWNIAEHRTAHHHGALGTSALGQLAGRRPAGRPAGHGVDFAKKT